MIPKRNSRISIACSVTKYGCESPPMKLSRIMGATRRGSTDKRSRTFLETSMDTSIVYKRDSKPTSLNQCLYEGWISRSQTAKKKSHLAFQHCLNRYDQKPLR